MAEESSIQYCQEQESNQKAKPRFTAQRAVEYYYPSSQFCNLYFKTTQEIKQYLVKQNQQLYKNMVLKNYKNAIYVYLHCRYCSNVISLKLVEGLWKVTKFANRHIHKIHKDKDRQQKQIRNYMAVHNLKFNNSTKALLGRIFKLSSRRYYYLKIKAENSDESLLRQLEQSRRVYWHQMGQQQYIPQNLVVVARKMIQIYEKYGQYLRLKIKTNLLRERSKHDKKWFVGLFIGIDQNSQQIIFGVAYFLKYNIQTLTKVIDAFMKIMKKPPQTIWTDLQQTVMIAMRNTQCVKNKQSVPMIQGFSILKHMRSQIGQKCILIKTIKELINCRNPKKSNSLIIEIQSLKFEQPQKNQAIKFFINNLRQYSYLLSKNRFIGLTICKQQAQIFPNTNISYFSMVKLLEHVLKYNQKTLTRKSCLDKSDLIGCFDDPILLQTKQSLSRNTFRHFLSTYLAIQQLSIQSQNQIEYLIVSRSQNSENIITKEGIVCNCGDKQKTGLPCCHMIKLLKYKKEDYKKYINQRWIIRQNSVRKSNSIGRPKLSRRNKGL